MKLTLSLKAHNLPLNGTRQQSSVTSCLLTILRHSPTDNIFPFHYHFILVKIRLDLAREKTLFESRRQAKTAEAKINDSDEI